MTQKSTDPNIVDDLENQNVDATISENTEEGQFF
jgi:hypothetical protein